MAAVEHFLAVVGLGLGAAAPALASLLSLDAGVSIGIAGAGAFAALRMLRQAEILDLRTREAQVCMCATTKVLA